MSNTRTLVILLIFIILQLFRGELPSQFYFPKDAMKYWNDHEMKGNVYTDWQWAGYITWKSNGTAKIFVDTRIEPFSSELIAMAQPININLIDNLGFLHKLKTEYLLLPIPECNNFIKLSTVSGLCTLLNKGDYYALMALNEERIKKMYY